MSALGDTGARPSRLGRYELITQIGQGGMAEVQLALQRGPAGFEKLVVVKLVHQNLASQKAFVDMLLDEARVAALVKHPNVVDIYDLGEAEGRYFIAMEYLEGEPLLAVLRAGREGKRLDVLSTARLIADTAEGLEAAHELRSIGGDPIELVHHDVSLGNIVVLYNGQVKLVDFGVAKASQSAGPKVKVQGKFSYMAPEKLRGAPGDRRSDIWSLGCVLWEALTLRRLFKGGNDADTMKQVLETPLMPPSQVNGDVAPDFDPIVMRALQRDPDKRYATAKAVAQDLEEVLRRNAYGGRNDLIAKYMQETFKPHIDARKKLLQEVSSKGRASAAVLEAAFEPVLATGTGSAHLSQPLRPMRTSQEFSVVFKRPSSEMSDVTAEGTPAQARAPKPSDLYPSAAGLEAAVLERADTNAPTVNIELEHIDDNTSAREKLEPPSSRTRLYLLLGLLAIAAITIVVVAIVHNGGAKSATANPPPDWSGKDPTDTTGSAGSTGSTGSTAGSNSGPAIPRGTTPPMPSTPPGMVVTPGGTTSAQEPPKDPQDDLVMEPVKIVSPPKDPKDTKDPKKQPPPPPPDKNAAETQFKAGLQALLVKGDARAALAAFKRSQQANPGYAPTWRGLGMAYEKLGEKGSAKAAFQRYLAILPNASDAAQIRARMEKL